MCTNSSDQSVQWWEVEAEVVYSDGSDSHTPHEHALWFPKVMLAPPPHSFTSPILTVSCDPGNLLALPTDTNPQCSRLYIPASSRVVSEAGPHSGHYVCPCQILYRRISVKTVYYSHISMTGTYQTINDQKSAASFCWTQHPQVKLSLVI